ncbi:MAG: 4-hydroxy-tetrahydrodipicolinate reductase [Flavobacteriales bacterium]|nr:4-hydroxy-tetrahydrodipicolinate reductase [Flavobacteriales bacterium]MCB9334663.1 4-hydroxy-tetrahydrodipicolinate reductase [Flavobacteriales bacterium]
MKIAIIGYGKMGKEIEQIALQRGHEVLLKITSSNLEDMSLENLQKCDVAIEFTRPDKAIENIKKCFDAHLPVVVGTTGWFEQLEEVKQLCASSNGTLLYASNCSLGVNIFFELNKKLAQLMKSQEDYQVQIEEIHHTQKLDAPSGTAITLAEGLIENYPSKSSWENNLSDNNAVLPVISHRIENVPGTHVIKYSSEIDEIEIKHTAHNRKGFASGAVIAAEYIAPKKGVFTMSDVLFN